MNAKSVEYVLYFDGVSRGNPGKGSSAALIMNKSTNKIVWQGCKYFGDNTVTNNVAEYHALLLGVNAMKKYEFNNVKIMGDSLLVVNQVKKIWKCKNAVLNEYLQKVSMKLKNKKYEISHIPREKNTLADKLANECLDNRKSISIVSKEILKD